MEMFGDPEQMAAALKILQDSTEAMGKEISTYTDIVKRAMNEQEAYRQSCFPSKNVNWIA